MRPCSPSRFTSRRRTQPASERPAPRPSAPSARHDAAPPLVLNETSTRRPPGRYGTIRGAMSTFYESQAGGDFDRERRRRAFRRIATRLRQAPDDVDDMLPFDEVRGGARLRRAARPGRADDPARLDRRHRRPPAVAVRPLVPADDGELRDRWQRVAAARRSGVALPPIEVYRVGGLHFVEDGHHRVSVARALGDDVIEARVREISTSVGASPDLRTSELPLKQHERIFFERVPLPMRAAPPGPAHRRVALRAARDARGGAAASARATPAAGSSPARSSPSSGTTTSSSRSWRR